MPYVIHKRKKKVKVRHGLTKSSLNQAGAKGGYKTKADALAAARKLSAGDATSTYTVKKIR